MPSSGPTNTLPSPTATPRLSQPQQTVLIFCSRCDRCCQISAPVRASSANTSSLPLAKYITPSLTIGVPSIEYFCPRPESEMHHPGGFEVLGVPRIDLFQRRVAGVVPIATDGEPFLGGRRAQIRLRRRRNRRKCQRNRREQRPYPHASSRNSGAQFCARLCISWHRLPQRESPHLRDKSLVGLPALREYG